MRNLLAVLAALALSGTSVACAETVLITGSDRGIGLEFVKQYAARGDTVIATCRHPIQATDLQALASKDKHVVVEKLDVSEDADIAALAARYKGRPIDILLSNAGVMGSHDEQAFGTFSRKAFHDVMDVNAFAPLAVSQALRDNVISSSGKKIIAITSGLSTIGTAGAIANGPYYYRMKAAMNMGVQAVGADLKSQGVAVALVSPGPVDTEMFRAYRSQYGSKRSPLTPADSVSKMIAVIDKLDQAKSAQGINNIDGTITPW